jgi:flagellar basal-body rod modification protein FlgD
MSISTVSSALASTTASSTTTSSTTTTGTTDSLDTDDFLSLIVAQLENQNPLDPTDTGEFVGQVMSYATFNQLASMSETLGTVSDTLTTIASQVASLYAASGSSQA